MSTPTIRQNPLVKPRIIEIRPGEGGSDAANFARELAETIRAYLRRREISFTESSTERTITLLVYDEDTPFERIAGSHRIQRIPPNDSRGRRHTSTASIAVLATNIPDSPTLVDADLRADFFRAAGPGGQHRNKTDSAVRLTHLPTGLVVTCAQSRSQYRNLQRARENLVERLTQLDRSRQSDLDQTTRLAQVKATNRSAKTWTWNTQRSRVTDHQENRTYDLRELSRGRLELVFE